jgi:hypothetical protein
VKQERVVGVRPIDDLLHVGKGEGTRELAVSGEARTPIAAERLPIEELLAVELTAEIGLPKRL